MHTYNRTCVRFHVCAPSLDLWVDLLGIICSGMLDLGNLEESGWNPKKKKNIDAFLLSETSAFEVFGFAENCFGCTE